MYIPRVLELLHLRYHQCWRILFLFSLTLRVYVIYLSRVRPCASSSSLLLSPSSSLFHFKNCTKDCSDIYSFDEISAAEFGFLEVFLFFWGTPFIHFSFISDWSYSLLIFPGISNYLFLPVFRRFSDCTGLTIPLKITIVCIRVFSLLYSLPISKYHPWGSSSFQATLKVCNLLYLQFLFPLILTGSFSLKSEWLQVSSDLCDSSIYCSNS